ncbi:hypothetical protein EDD17DRAFT_1604602 [Pisolithus thermaeus]|nr:hypothetical protein EDD17DRAFT_1604602 [Pisolithus thermaeus]
MERRWIVLYVILSSSLLFDFLCCKYIWRLKLKRTYQYSPRPGHAQIRAAKDMRNQECWDSAKSVHSSRAS